MSTSGLSWDRQLRADEEDTANRDEFNARHDDEEMEDSLDGKGLAINVGSPPIPEQPPPSSPQSEVSNTTEEPEKKRSKATTSAVWNHYTVSWAKGNKIVKCNYCSHPYTDPSGTTTMKLHISNKHPGKLKPVSRPPIPQAFLSTSNDTPKITKHKQEAITKRLETWVVCSAQPFSSVDDPHFIALLKEANSVYKIPCRKTIRKNIVDDFVDRCKAIVAELRAVRGRFSMTTDMWQANAKKQSYIVITLHWIDEDWALKNIVLDFKYVPVRHTGDNMKNIVMDSLKEYSLSHRILCVTTDGAANMKTFFRGLSTDMEKDRKISGRNTADVPSFRVWCVAHLVQTVAKVATEAKADIVSQIRAMVTFIHRATTAEEYMAFAGVENLCLPLDVVTRWNSLLQMIEAAFKQRDNITNFISTKKGEILKERLEDEEWVEIDNLIELLKPLEQVTVECSAYKTPTFHLGLSQLLFIREHLRDFVNDDTKPEWMIDLANKMAAQLERSIKEEWTTEEKLCCPAIARMLDPSMKDGEYADEILRSEHRKQLKALVLLYEAATVRAASREDTAVPLTSKATSSIRAKLLAKATSNANQPLTDEVDKYLDAPKEPFDRDILEFWRTSVSVYPVLSQIAKDFLAVCASSVPSECSFSGSGRVITALRNSLEPVAVQAVMCLSSWQSLCEANSE